MKQPVIPQRSSSGDLTLLWCKQIHLKQESVIFASIFHCLGDILHSHIIILFSSGKMEKALAECMSCSRSKKLC